MYNQSSLMAIASDQEISLGLTATDVAMELMELGEIPFDPLLWNKMVTEKELLEMEIAKRVERLGHTNNPTMSFS